MWTLIIFVLLIQYSYAIPSYKECTQCEYIQDPRPYSNAFEFNIITDRNFDPNCVMQEYTSLNYCLEKACNRGEDNIRDGVLIFPCEDHIKKDCPACGEHGTCETTISKIHSDGYCKNQIVGPVPVQSLEDCASRSQYIVIDKRRTQCYELRDFSTCNRMDPERWLFDDNYDTYVSIKTCKCDAGWSGLECKEYDECCESYSAECLACKAGIESWEFCSNLLNVPPYNVQQAEELGCAKILETKAGITGDQYKHLSLACGSVSQDASATWTVDGEKCSDFGRKIQGTEIWRCAASGHMDYSNHQLPLPNDVCCVCGYKTNVPAVNCTGQWTDIDTDGNGCGTYIITKEKEGTGLSCPYEKGTIKNCKLEDRDCTGTWTRIGGDDEGCGRFIITQEVQGNGKPCFNVNGASRECAKGDSCRLTGGDVVDDGWAGLDTGSNYCNTCQCNDGVLICTLIFCDGDLPCRLNEGNSVPSGWTGQDNGDNHCNTCNCKNGELMCTRLACLPQCPIPGCIAPPPECEYIENGELHSNGCPKYPCGILKCQENHTATVDRYYLSRDYSMMTIYYSGTEENNLLGIVSATIYSNVNDTPTNSNYIVAKRIIDNTEGFVNLNIEGFIGPFFITIWNSTGHEISKRELFDKFQPDFLANNCPVGEADRQFPWDDGLAVAGGLSRTCADYAKWDETEQSWACNTPQAGWDTDRDFLTAINTCCACDLTGKLYNTWALENGIIPFNCEMICPGRPHFHTISETFNWMRKYSRCDTVHLWSCGGETVWSPCPDPLPCKYKPKTPNPTELSLIEFGQYINNRDKNVFSDNQWEIIWGINEELKTTEQRLDRLEMMREKIDRIYELQLELQTIVIPPVMNNTESGAAREFNRNRDWLNKLLEQAKENLLYRDLSTYPALIQRLRELSDLIIKNEDSSRTEISKKIRHAMRYELSVLVEDFNTAEEANKRKFDELDNRTNSIQFTQEELQEGLWALENSYIGISEMVKYEIEIFRKDVTRVESNDEQIFARLAELTLIAANVEEELFKNAMNDSNHTAAIEALIREIDLIKWRHNENMTEIQKELDNIRRKDDMLNYKIDEHINALHAVVMAVKDDMKDLDSTVMTRLSMLEDAYQQTASYVESTWSFLNKRVNEIWQAVLDRATKSELLALEQELIMTEIRMRNYADAQGKIARDLTVKMVNELEERMNVHILNITKRTINETVVPMIDNAYKDSLEFTKQYAQQVGDSVFDLAKTESMRIGDLVRSEAFVFAEEQSTMAKIEAQTFADNLVNQAVDSIRRDLESNVSHINVTFVMMKKYIDDFIVSERNAMFLTIEERAKELEKYAANIAATEARLARINATNTALAKIDELGATVNDVNNTLFNEFHKLNETLTQGFLVHIQGEISTIQQMISVVKGDILSTNSSVQTNMAEISDVSGKLNNLITQVDQFKTDVQQQYVSKENFALLNDKFNDFVVQEQERYDAASIRFARVDATISSLELNTSMVIMSQDQKIILLQEALDALRSMHLGNASVILDIQRELSILNKIQEDYHGMDLREQLAELHARMSMHYNSISSISTRVSNNYNNITSMADTLSTLTGDLDEQKRQLLELETSIIYGTTQNISILIAELRAEIDEKIDQNELLRIEQEIQNQKNQLQVLDWRIKNITEGNDTSGVDLETRQRLTMLENQVNALQGSSFNCGTGEIDMSCSSMIQNLYAQFANTTLRFESNEDRLDEIENVLDEFGDNMTDIKTEMNMFNPSITNNTMFINNLQNRILAVEMFINTYGPRLQSGGNINERLEYLEQQINNSKLELLVHDSRLSTLNQTLHYMTNNVNNIPILISDVEALIESFNAFKNTTVETTMNNKIAFDNLEGRVNETIEQIDTLGDRSNLIELELNQSIENLRAEFLNMPASSTIMSLINNLNNRIDNISTEITTVQQQQAHYNFQIDKLEDIRNDLHNLQNITITMYNQTLNQTMETIVNSSEFDIHSLNGTVDELLHRIEILEDVINAHTNMNFSMQISSLESLVQHHTAQAHLILNQINGSIELTNEQINDLVNRLALLTPNQDLINIRNDLDRLIALEAQNPLINITSQLHHLDERIKLYENLLPPETLDEILEDIRILKNKVENDTVSNNEIILIKNQIQMLVEAAQNHSDNIGDLSTITMLLNSSSLNHETQINEILVELDTLENAINSVVVSEGDESVNNRISNLNQSVVNLIATLENKIAVLKHELRYYSSCSHTDDCKIGQRCNKMSSCEWDPTSIICAWEALSCDSTAANRCHSHGDCRLLKHVWDREFKTTECNAQSTNCLDHGRTPDDVELVLYNESNITIYVGEKYVETGGICEDWNWRYPVWIRETPALNVNVVGDYLLTYTCGNLKKYRMVTVKYKECLTGPLTCSNGRIVYPDKTNNCSYNCHDYLHECTFEGFAGPDCKCSPNWEGCEGMSGNVRATWDGENCGCESI